MAVLLLPPGRATEAGTRPWCCVGAVPAGLDAAAALPELERRLEAALDASGPELLARGRELSRRPDAVLAHAPGGAANVSDLAVMLAWTRLADDLAAAPGETALICGDPWLYRALCGRPGVAAPHPPPPLAWRRLRLALRGLAARLAVSFRMARAALARPGQLPQGRPALLVYGHPASTADGADAYFGPLLREMPDLVRVLHVDCPPARAAALAGERTVSLHGYGSPLYALTLWARRWRPASGDWLVRRAAALEGGGGQAAMIAWQLHCQRRWLAATRPKLVAWPWENHGWERDLVRAARAAGIATLGYQHTTVGRQEWNHSPASSPDDSLPDRIFCTGAADRARLAAFGCPPERLAVAGAWRFAGAARPAADPSAPVFAALPFDPLVAAEIVAALRPIAAAGRRVLVKDHPMSPHPVAPSPGLEPTTSRLGELPAVAAVVYAATAVGLEAVLAGLPTIRFLPRCRPVVDVMPEGAVVAAAAAADLAAVLIAVPPPPPLARERVFAPVDHELWREALS